MRVCRPRAARIARGRGELCPLLRLQRRPAGLISIGHRLGRERQVNARVIPTRQAIEESVDLAHEVFNLVFRRVPEQVKGE